MPAVRIHDFEWDLDNEAHCAAHGVWAEDLGDALDSGEWAVAANKRGMAATHLFVGRNRAGRVVTAAIVETSTPAVWRPISAWPAKPHEAALLR